MTRATRIPLSERLARTDRYVAVMADLLRRGEREDAIIREARTAIAKASAAIAKTEGQS